MDMELLIKVFMFESFVLWLSYFYAVNEETNIMESYELNTNKMWILLKRITASPTGNRTPVSRVTGGDTYHYTIEDMVSGAMPQS